jgi:hypothetical protein
MQALAVPPIPGFQGPGARVEHVLAPRDGQLSEVVTEALGLPQASPRSPRPLPVAPVFFAARTLHG